jgi:DNA-binding LytR/AlgR family response regulator
MKLGRNYNVVFETTTVMYFEADSNYTIIHFKLGKKQLYARCLGFIHSKVGEDFVRIHSKYLVNRSCIKTYDFDSVELHNDLVLPIAKRRKHKPKKPLR